MKYKNGGVGTAIWLGKFGSVVWNRSLCYQELAVLVSVGILAAVTAPAAPESAESGSTRQPLNVILMMADQLRADYLGVAGHPLVRTPHLDRLAREGVRFTAGFAQHPQCAPSRSSLLTGRYPHVNGCFSNYVAMDPGEMTVADHLRRGGYATSAFGKLHIFEKKTREGFATLMLCGGQNSGETNPESLFEPERFAPAYETWLRTNGYWEAVVRMCAQRATPAYRDSFQAVVSPLPQQAYFDVWIGDRVVEALEGTPRGIPFFMFVGFPNPHNPFEPPEPYASMYNPDDMRVPATFHADLSKKPPHQLAYKRAGRTNNYETLTPAKLRRVMAYYLASITLVDDQVGKILGRLERLGLLENTLILFTSDHGEFMGDYGMLLKSTDEFPMLLDVGLRVPLICRLPKGAKGVVIDTPVELIDLCPTILEAAGLALPPEVQGKSLLPVLRGSGPAPTRDFVFAETSAVKMIRSRTHKLVHYPGQTYGELYDLLRDPMELDNLYDVPAQAVLREKMTRELLDHLIRSEAPRHGQGLRGPAYWRRAYAEPFKR